MQLLVASALSDQRSLKKTCLQSLQGTGTIGAPIHSCGRRGDFDAFQPLPVASVASVPSLLASAAGDSSGAQNSIDLTLN